MKDIDGNKRAEDTPAWHKWRCVWDAEWGIIEEECGVPKALSINLNDSMILYL